jgi:zinc/manganese transport system substrate-binding protein
MIGTNRERKRNIMRYTLRQSIGMLVVFTFVLALVATGPSFAAGKKLHVVTTLPDYAYLAREIGGDRVEVEAIVLGDQDAHFIRPKPSFVSLVKKADMLVSTGLDLELWLPTIVDKSGNTRVRSGEVGYVAAAQGISLLEKPSVMSKSEGDVHIYGNPHINSSPLNMKVAARNICTGLIKNDPEGKAFYEANLDALLKKFDERLFGRDLVDILGGETLCKLAEKGTLISFLQSQQLNEEPLIDRLGGWMKQMLPLNGKEIVTYHKNWVYFMHLFNIHEAGTIEPKPGISPPPKHVTELIDLMKTRSIKIILAANYFDEQKIKTIANRVGAEAVIVPLYVGGVSGVDDYLSLMDYWIAHLLDAAQRTGLVAEAAR